jgi:hypothetical protein
MFQSIYSEIALACLVLFCGFAIWKGSDAVRAGAILIVATWLVTLLASAVTRSYVPATAFLASDGIMAIGLLFLAVRYSNWWMGAAMMLQAIALALHAGYFQAERADLSKHVLRNYVMGKNLASAGLLLIILAATIANVLSRRAKASKARASASAPASQAIAA